MNKTHTLPIFAFIVLLGGILLNIITPPTAQAVITKQAARTSFTEFQEKCSTKAKYNNNKRKCDSIVNTLKQNPPGCGTLNKDKILRYMNQCENKISSMSTTPTPSGSGPGSAEVTTARDTCGGGERKVELGFSVGCVGRGNPIADMTFAIIRFLTVGVGIVVIGSIMYGSLQYIGSRGDPNNTARAIDRIRGSVIALLLFIFTYAILSYVVPGQILK